MAPRKKKPSEQLKKLISNFGSAAEHMKEIAGKLEMWMDLHEQELEDKKTVAPAPVKAKKKETLAIEKPPSAEPASTPLEKKRKSPEDADGEAPPTSAKKKKKKKKDKKDKKDKNEKKEAEEVE